MMWGAVTASDGYVSSAKPVELTVEVGTTDSFEKSLGAGMRSLYKDSLFLDVALVAGGRKFPAHKAVLASTSDAFRARLTEAVAAAEATTAPVEEEGASSGESSGVATPEINFPNISHPEAISSLLDHIYGIDEGLIENYVVGDDATNKDVLQLAVELQIPSLKEFATHWMTQDLTSANIFSRLAIAQEFKLDEFFEGASGALASEMPALREVTDDLTVVNHPSILQALLIRVASCPTPNTKKSMEQRPTKRARTAAGGGA